MKLREIYIGFTKKDGKERCLARIYRYVDSDLGLVTFTQYKDLETQEFFDHNEVDSESLIPFTKIFKQYENKKRMRKRKIKSVYKVDRDTLIPIKVVFYGDIFKINPDPKIKTVIPDLTFDSIEKDLLLKKDEENSFIALKDETSYIEGLNTSNDILLNNIRPVVLKESELSKRKLLEKAYKQD